MRAEKKYVACSYSDQGNQLGQLQVIAVSAPDLAGQQLMVAYFSPADAQVSTGTSYVTLDAGGHGNISFKTTAGMVGQPVRLEGWEMLHGTYNSSDVRHCPTTNFTIPPPS
jgi:hypothetical protein